MAAPSPSWLTIPVHGTYKKADGTPHAGSIRFTFNQRVTNATDDVIFPAGSVLEVALGAETGSMTIQMPVVDDPDNSPSGWSILVEERLIAGGGKSYNIQPTTAMASGGLNLRTVVIPDNAPNVNVPVLRGVPGGIANLDADGDVVDSAGNKVKGTGGGTVTVVDGGTP